MSWDTVIQVMNTGDVPVKFESIEAAAGAILDRDGIDRDFLEDLRMSFEQGESIGNVHSHYVHQVFSQLAPLITQGGVEVRCLGEEFRHTWIMSIKEGHIDFSAGPWEYEDFPHTITSS